MIGHLLVILMLFSHTMTKAEIFHFTTSDDFKVRVDYSNGVGTLRQPVLILMSHLESIEDHLPLAHSLNYLGFPTWILEWRGQGQSARHPCAPQDILYIDSYETYANDLRRFIKYHLSHTRFHILAHGMGAHILIKSLLKEPCRNLDRVALIAPFKLKDFPDNLGVPYISKKATAIEQSNWITIPQEHSTPQYISSAWYQATQHSLNHVKKDKKYNQIQHAHKLLILTNDERSDKIADYLNSPNSTELETCMAAVYTAVFMHFLTEIVPKL